MPKPAGLERYPHRRYLQVEAAFKQGKLIIICPSPGDAQQLRFEHYAFHKALLKEGHPYSTFSSPLKFVWKKDSQLIIFNRNNTDALYKPDFKCQVIREDETPEVNQPLMSQPTGPALTSISEFELQQTIERLKEKARDPMEAALEKLGIFAGISSKKKE